MLIQTFPSGPFSTNAYIVACTETDQAAIVDPAPHSSDAIISFLADKGLEPTSILITHSHWDHIGDAATLKMQFQSPIYVHSLDQPNLKNPGSDGLPLLSTIEGVEPDHLLEDGDSVTVGNLKFLVIHTPGHTPGGICFYNQEHGVLFSGDTLFKGSIGNLSFPTANSAKMWASLSKLAKLPAETVVYPGHGPPTTIGKESWLENAKELFGY